MVAKRVAKVTNTADEINIISPELKEKVSAIENEVLVVADEPQEEPVKAEEEVVLVAKPVKVVAPIKMIRVLMKKDHKCHIGGEWYVLYQDKYYNVPENVRDILNRADLLKPL